MAFIHRSMQETVRKYFQVITLYVFIDFDTAFYRLDWNIVTRMLTEVKVPSYLMTSYSNEDG